MLHTAKKMNRNKSKHFTSFYYKYRAVKADFRKLLKYLKYSI